MILYINGQESRIDPLAIFSPNETLGHLGIAYKQSGDKVCYYNFEDGKSYLADPKRTIPRLPHHLEEMCKNDWWKGVTCTFIDKKDCIGEVGTIFSGTIKPLGIDDLLTEPTLKLVVMCGSVGRFPVNLSQIALTGHINQNNSL